MKQPDAITERNQLRAEVARLNSEIETLKRAVDHFSTEKELIRRENVELRTQSAAAVRVADAVVNAWRVAKRRGSKAETLATLEAVDKAVEEYEKLSVEKRVESACHNLDAKAAAVEGIYRDKGEIDC